MRHCTVSAHVANVLKDALPLHLQDAQHAPPTLAFHSPTGTTLALLHLLGQADAGIHLHQANTAMEAAGLASQHKWGIILPTSARVANSIYEPAIATIYPTLCEVHDKQWRIGTPRCTSRTGYPTGPRYIRLHPSLYENRPVSADEARQVFRLITQGMKEFHIGNTAQTGLLVMTNRSEVKAALDSRPRTGDEQYIQVENVVTVAGATARHGLILQFNVGFLSGNSQKMTDDDITESYLRANVGYTRAASWWPAHSTWQGCLESSKHLQSSLRASQPSIDLPPTTNLTSSINLMLGKFRMLTGMMRLLETS